MDGNLREELKAEYTLLQGQYEAFDARALTIKSLSAPLLAGGIGLGVKEHSVTIVLAAVLAAVCLWLLEAMWKSFQYCYTDRIKLIEAWFRTGQPSDIAPFQIFSAWGAVFDRHFQYFRSLLPIIRQRFVYLPYLPIVIFGLIAVAIILFVREGRMCYTDWV